jgi:hypothetical protein
MNARWMELSAGAPIAEYLLALLVAAGIFYALTDTGTQPVLEHRPD